MKVTTAVIFASGFGSRMLPVTAAVQKELLPILDRPVIDYVVADCVAAGITRIIFVVHSDSHDLQNYYTGNSALTHHLERFSKREALAKLDNVHTQATFDFIEQPETNRYGTAIPLQFAAPHLPKNEAFVVCGGDDFLWHPDGRSEIAELVSLFENTRSAGALMALERPLDELHRYGVLQVEARAGQEYLKRIVEKPAPGSAPSNLINISKYILTPELLDFVIKITPDPKSGEYYLTDAIQSAAADHKVVVHRAEGEFLDAGNLPGWLHANLTVAKSRPDLAAAIETVTLSRA